MHHQRHSSGGHTLIIARQPPLHSRMSMQDSSRGRGNGAGMAPNFLVFSMPIIDLLIPSITATCTVRWPSTKTHHLKI